MRFAEPSRGQFFDVNYLQTIVNGGKIIENARGGVRGAIIDSDDFEMGIVNGDQRGESGGKFFFFVASSEDE